MKRQGYAIVFKKTILEKYIEKINGLHLMSSRCKICTLHYSNSIYHKVSHDATSYTLNGEIVMLESAIIYEPGKFIL